MSQANPNPTLPYTTHLAPLMEQVQETAAAQNIPFLASFFDPAGEAVIGSASFWPGSAHTGPSLVDTSEVRGQEHVLRALEVAAAGGHNLLLLGSQGAGKSFLARCLPPLLPHLNRDPSIVPVRPPFRTPQTSIGLAAFAGSQRRMTLGEVSLAHHGVLLLRDLAAYKPSVLSVLRQAVEENVVLLERERFPAAFQLIATMDPCPCGFYTDPIRECRCSVMQIMHYYQRVRETVHACFDLVIEVPTIQLDQLTRARANEPSARIQERVTRARFLQLRRYQEQPFSCNAALPPAAVIALDTLEASAQKLLNAAITQLHLAPGAVARTLRVAQSIADLAASEQIKVNHIAEAIQYRSTKHLPA